MWDQLGEFPRADFLVTPKDRLTRGDLSGLVRGILAVFDANGLMPGSRVLILTRNEPLQPLLQHYWTGWYR
jgi:hypothetical protein